MRGTGKIHVTEQQAELWRAIQALVGPVVVRDVHIARTRVIFSGKYACLYGYNVCLEQRRVYNRPRPNYTVMP